MRRNDITYQVKGETWGEKNSLLKSGATEPGTHRLDGEGQKSKEARARKGIKKSQVGQRWKERGDAPAVTAKGGIRA